MISNCNGFLVTEDVFFGYWNQQASTLAALLEETKTYAGSTGFCYLLWFAVLPLSEIGRESVHHLIGADVLCGFRPPTTSVVVPRYIRKDDVFAF
jgi:hypothetical protein